MKKFLFIIILTNCFILNIFANSEKLLTICDVQKSASVSIEPKILNAKGNLDILPTRFDVDEKPTGERYILSLIKEEYRSAYQEASQLGFFNISYISKNYASNRWNTLTKLRILEGQGKVLNNRDPIILRMYYPEENDQVYYFKLDKEGNGTMTMVNTRWNSLMDIINSQSLFYATCRNPYLVKD